MRLKLKPLDINWSKLLDWLCASLNNEKLWDKVVLYLEDRGLPHDQAVEVAGWVRTVLLVELAQAEEI